LQNAYLMHAILGVACLHLNHLQPGNQQRKLHEGYHWECAIRLYQTAMQAKIGPHNVDALIGSCILLGSNTVCTAGFRPSHSWVFTSNPADLNWLALQGGLRCLLDLTAPFLGQSIWGESFRDAEEELRPFQDDRPGRDGLDPELADLCGIDDSTNPQTSPYHGPLRLLSPMLARVPHDRPENYTIFVSFMGQLPPEFITLLRAKDPPALVVLAYWMGLMCTQSTFQVWILARIRPECIAICQYLESATTEPRILNLLRFPATACGHWGSECSRRVCSF
jgi:hypothetical protein